MNLIPQDTFSLDRFINEQKIVWQNELERVSRSLDAYSSIEKNFKELFYITIDRQIRDKEASKLTFEDKLSIFQLSETYLDSTLYPLSLRLLGLTTTSKPKEYQLILDGQTSHYFDLKKTHLQDRIVKLQLMFLNGEQLTHIFSPSVETFSNIRSLSIQYCTFEFTKEQLNSLNKLKHLFRHFPKLKSITLKGPQITDNIVRTWIKPFKKTLQTIKIDNCPNVTDDMGYLLAEYPSKLKTLSLKNCTAITHQIINPIKEKSQNISSLDLSNCPGISDQVIAKLIKYKYPFSSLYLSQHKYLTDSLLSNLVTNCGKGLTSIDVSSCDEITNTVIKTIVDHCTNLTHINLGKCPKLTHNAIEILVKSSLNLTSIDVEDPNLTDNHVNIIAERFGNSLKRINIKGHDKISTISAHTLVKKCQNLFSAYLLSDYFFTEGILQILIQRFPNLIVHYQNEAMNGHATSQCILGSCLAFGIGLKSDLKEAFNWFKSAADQNDARAQYILGWCYQHGLGVVKNAEKADIWFNKATENGHSLGNKKKNSICSVL